MAESQYHREDVGPIGYTYSFSASFSGGGFFSSSATWETVALAASSLLGDVMVVTATATSPPAPPTPTAVPASDSLDLTLVFGPVDGSLTLEWNDDQIPDFSSGVTRAAGVVDVTFTNPDVGGGAWSYGITFRQSEEETFHAVYLTSAGVWGHFARGGSVGAESDLGSGNVAINTGAGERNRLTVVFGPVAGILRVNGETVAELDLSLAAAQEAGDIRVMAGLFGADVLNGAETGFSGFTIWSP